MSLDARDAAGPEAGSPLVGPDTGVRAIRGGAIRTAATVVGLLVAIVSAPLMVRHLGGEEFGRLARVQSLVTITTALVEGGLTNVAIRGYALGDRRQRIDLIRALLGLRIATVLAASLVVVTYVVLAGFERRLVVGTFIALTGLLAGAYQTALATPLAADLRLGAMAALELLRSVLIATFQLTLVFLGATMLPFLALPAAAYFVASVVTRRLVRGDVSAVPRFEVAAWKPLLRETGVYAVATAMGTVCFQLALQILGLVGTERDVGNYAVAFRIAEIGNTLPWVVVGAVFPVLVHAAEHDRKRFGDVLQSSYRTLAIVGCAVALGLVFGAGFAIDVVAGGGGDDVDIRTAESVLRIIGLAAPATYLVALGSLALLALGRIRFLLAWNGVALVLSLTCGALLGRALGAQGAALSTVIVEWFLALGYAGAVWVAGHLARTSERRSLWLIAAVGVASVAGALVQPLGALPAAVVALTAFGCVVLVRGLVPAEVWDAIPASIRRRLPSRLR